MTWNYFISAVYCKNLHLGSMTTCSSWLLLFFSTPLFCTQYKKIEKILRQLGGRIPPLLKILLHHCMCALCVQAILWIIHVEDTTCKKSFPFFLITSNSFFLSNWLSFWRQKPVEQRMLFNSKYVYKCEKKQSSQKKIHRKKKFLTIVLTISVVDLILEHIAISCLPLNTSVCIVFNLIQFT